MNKNVKLKLKIKKIENIQNPITPSPNDHNSFFGSKFSPRQNAKINFNSLFHNENKHNSNQKPMNFNNNLLNEHNNKNEIQKNHIDNVDIKYNREKSKGKFGTNHIKQKSDKNHKMLDPINLTGEKNKKLIPMFKKNVLKNRPPTKDKYTDETQSKSSNILPSMKKDDKRLLNKGKDKALHHNKSNNRIRIFIDCSSKSKLEENKQVKSPNKLLIKKISSDSSINSNEKMNKIDNIIKTINIKNQIQKKLISYFYKEEPNLDKLPPGKEKSMEDFVLIKNDFLKLENHNISLFAIFDGHGGKIVAQYLKNNFCDALTKIINEKSNVELIDNIKTAIETIDEDLKKLNDDAKECGSTGTIVVIDKDILYCANVGDSRCFYIDDKKAVQMTEDHNCKNELEVDKIKKRGAMVFSGKVYGALSLTRAFGDTDYKEFGVICEPHIEKISINNINYVVIASDGVWDIVDDKQLFKIGNELKKGNSEEFCNNLVEYALKGDSHDNISCIVLKFGN